MAVSAPIVPPTVETEVADQHVGAGARHCRGLRRFEHVGRGQEVARSRLGDHLDFAVVSHAGFFEAGAEAAVDQADGGEILHAAEAKPRDFVEKDIHLAEWIGTAHAG